MNHGVGFTFYKDNEEIKEVTYDAAFTPAIGQRICVDAGGPPYLKGTVHSVQWECRDNALLCWVKVKVDPQ